MPFGSLWLPVVVATVGVWLISAILHMVLKYHRADYKKLADEDGIAAAIRKAGPSPGVYFMPYCADHSQMKDPAMAKRFQDGPVASLTVMPSGPPAMGKYLVLWLVYCFLVSFLVAYVARLTLDFGTGGFEVLRLTATVAFAAYGFGYLQDSIWKAIPWSNSLRSLIDALVYALVTGLIFRLLWPAA